MSNDRLLAGKEQSLSLSSAPVGLAILFLIAACFVFAGWQTWPDPLVDVGYELYTFWRISVGDVLYRDLHYYYGPVSAYFNALVFRLLGTSIQNLVLVNLLIYSAILTLLYHALRLAWGSLGAILGGSVFVCVFSFSHFAGFHNYTYALPYAHESTHGMLIVLCTLWLAHKWRMRVSPAIAFGIGLCGGITVVMKPEYMLATGMIAAIAIVMRWLVGVKLRAIEWLLIASGLVLPTLLFTLWFWMHVPPGQAFIYASQAWWLVLVDRYQAQETIFLSFMGLDQPWRNLRIELLGTLLAGGLIVGTWCVGRLMNLAKLKIVRFVIAPLLAATLIWLAYTYGTPPGRCLPGSAVLILGYLVVEARRQLKSTHQIEPGTAMAILLVAAAIVMLLRMALNARLAQFGFVQAMLAGTTMAAFLAAEVPRWLKSSEGKIAARLCVAGLIVATYVQPVYASLRLCSLHTEPVGEEGDRVYAFDSRITPIGSLVELTRQRLAELPQGTMLAMPQGRMINYLSRRHSPLPVPLFIRSALAGDKEAKIVEQLQAAPPDYIVLISLDMRELGINRFGAPGEPGHQIVQWMQRHYLIDRRWGGDPLDPNQKGAMILVHEKAGGR